jgi:hypothetical protein
MNNAVVRIIAVAVTTVFLCACSDPDATGPAVIRDALNDTGITWGGSYPRGVNDDCSGAIEHAQLAEGDMVKDDILPQQDCVQGRDVTGSDDRDGVAGFVYRKLSDSGEVLPVDAKNWACVLDEITGLLWEVKQAADKVYGNQGLQDGDDLFTWYNGNQRINGGAIGDWNSRYDQCTGYIAGQPATYCNIEEFVSRFNKQGLCGFHDWRVPTLPELATLVNFGRIQPAIDITYFPNTQHGFHWSSSPDANLQTTAWAINFQLGYSAAVPRDNGRYVRLVRDWKIEPE